jgi:hypothetical protein
MTHIEMTMRRKRRRMTRKMRRRVWLSRLHHPPRAKQETSSEDECLSFDELDDGKIALFVKRFDKFMVNMGYHARRKKSSSKNKDEVRRCFKCNNKDNLVVECPYNGDNDDDNKKNMKKDKKKKKENTNKMTLKKKKGGSYVVT